MQIGQVRTPEPVESTWEGQSGGLLRGYDLPFVFSVVVWAALSTLLFVFILLFGQNVPYHDDIGYVPVLSGAEPVEPGWFWELHNPHRFPVVRLILLGASRCFGYDLRVIYLLSGALLASASLILLFACFRARGRGSWFDAVLPLYGVSLVHYFNIIEALSLAFCLYLLLFALVIAAAMRQAWVTRSGAALLGTVVILLSANAGYGLAASLVFIPGLVVLALYVMREGRADARARAGVLLFSAFLAAVSAGAYLRALALRSDRRGEIAVPPPELFDRLEKFLGALAMAWGKGLPTFLHPADSWASLFPFAALIGLGIALGLALVARSGPDRLRGAGLLLAFSAVHCVAAAVAVGRGQMPWMGPWYATMFTPLPWTLYLIGSMNPRAVVRFGIGGSLAVLGVLSVFNSTGEAWRSGAERRLATEKLLHDARTGVAPAELASMHLIDRWSVMRWKGGVYELMAERGISLFDESQTWLLEPPRFPEGREWNLSRIDVSAWAPDPPEAGRVRRLRPGVLLQPLAPNVFFPIAPVRPAHLEAGLIRLTISSPVETTAKFRIGPDLLAEAAIHPGTNALTFLLPDPAPGFVPLLSPGEFPGEYRVLSIWTYPFPVPPSAYPRSPD